MRIQISAKSTLCYLSTLWLIIISGVITLGPQTNNFAIITIGTIILSVILVSRGRDKCVLKSTFYLLIILLFVISVQLILELINGSIWYGSLKLIVIIIFCYLLSTRIELSSLYKAFANIIVFFAAVSIILYWFNSAIIKLPFVNVISTSAVERYYNLYIYCVLSSVPHRNCGIFWEPGAYAVFLNLALIFLMFNRTDEKRSLIKILILIIALITTISTQGYVCLLVILFAYFGSGLKKNKYYISLVLLIAIAIALYYFSPIINASFSYKFGIGNYQLSNSVKSRINPFLLDLRIIKDHPLGLIGVDTYYDTLVRYSSIYALPFVSSSCTPTMTVAVFGLVPGILLLYYVFLFGKSLSENNNRRQAVILGIGVVALFLTESFLVYGLYYALAFFSAEKNAMEK